MKDLVIKTIALFVLVSMMACEDKVQENPYQVELVFKVELWNVNASGREQLVEDQYDLNVRIDGEDVMLDSENFLRFKAIPHELYNVYCAAPGYGYVKRKIGSKEVEVNSDTITLRLYQQPRFEMIPTHYDPLTNEIVGYVENYDSLFMVSGYYLLNDSLNEHQYVAVTSNRYNPMLSIYSEGSDSIVFRIKNVYNITNEEGLKRFLYDFENNSCKLKLSSLLISDKEFISSSFRYNGYAPIPFFMRNYYSCIDIRTENEEMTTGGMTKEYVLSVMKLKTTRERRYIKEEDFIISFQPTFTYNDSDSSYFFGGKLVLDPPFDLEDKNLSLHLTTDRKCRVYYEGKFTDCEAGSTTIGNITYGNLQIIAAEYVATLRDLYWEYDVVTSYAD